MKMDSGDFLVHVVTQMEQNRLDKHLQQRRWYYPGNDRVAVIRLVKRKCGIELQNHEADRILRLYAFMQQEFDDCRHPGSARTIRTAMKKVAATFALDYETERDLVKDLDWLEKIGLLVADDSVKKTSVRRKGKRA